MDSFLSWSFSVMNLKKKIGTFANGKCKLKWIWMCFLSSYWKSSEIIIKIPSPGDLDIINTWQCLMEVVLEFLLKTIRIIKYLKEWRKILMSFIKTLPLNRLSIFQVIFYSNWRILFLSLNVDAATEVNKSIKSDIFSCKVNCSGNRIVLFALICVVFKN